MIKKIISEIEINLEKREKELLAKRAGSAVKGIRYILKRKKIDADVFVGGSLAKGTLVKSGLYDIDIFMRFNPKYKDLPSLLAKIIKEFSKKEKTKFEKVHGSRDYFRGILEEEKIIYEIIPVLRIKKAKDAVNVTDASYFHVNYVKKNLKNSMKEQVMLAKQFCKAQKVYGAESYINGFSGYGLECLIIYYKSFEKMLKILANLEEKIVIDPAKHYKNKTDVFYELNESKLKSPIVLIDPTWKERNVLAALSYETFEKFKNAASAFLKKPSKKFFEICESDFSKMREFAKKKKAEFIHLILKTDRQAGDIAGTKMKKGANFLIHEIEKYFDVLSKEFVYAGGQNAELYIAVKSKKEIIREGPSLERGDDVARFRAKHGKRIFEKNGILYARIPVNFSSTEFVRDFVKKYKNVLIGMGISELKIKND